MTMTTSSPRRLTVGTARRRRASQYVEFAILLPIFLAMLLFIINIGAIVMTQTGLQDVAQQVAQSGAQSGGLAGCPLMGSCTSGVFYEETRTAISQIPGASVSQLDQRYSPYVIAGGTSTGCSATSPYVTVKISYRPTIVFPGVSAVLTSFAPNWELSVTATARCEISIG